MRQTKRTLLDKRDSETLGPDRLYSPEECEGPDLGEVFWSGSDPVLNAAVFDIVLDENIVEPLPGETPEAWRARVEEAVRVRADGLRRDDRNDAYPPGPSR